MPTMAAPVSAAAPAATFTGLFQEARQVWSLGMQALPHGLDLGPQFSFLLPMKTSLRVSVMIRWRERRVRGQNRRRTWSHAYGFLASLLQLLQQLKHHQEHELLFAVGD